MIESGSIDRPYPVSWFDDFLPKTMYDDISKEWPREGFELLRNGKWVIVSERKSHSYERFVKLKEDSRAWRSFFRFCRVEFRAWCASAFPRYSPALVKGVRIELSEIGPGGEVAPHGDTPKKIVSGVLHVPHPEWTGPSGEFEVLEPISDLGGLDVSRDEVEWGRVRTVCSVPVVPNRIVLMRKTEMSLHGVRPISGAVPRRSITITLLARHDA